MKEFDVCLPITGKLCITVEAESEKDAIKKAMNSEDISVDLIEEWEVMEHITQGNVFYGMQNSASAEETKWA